MHDYNPSLAFTGPVVLFGLVLDQQIILGTALIAVGAGALLIRKFWRPGKAISES